MYLKRINKSYVSFLFCFGQRARWNLGKVVVILSVIPTVSCSTERSLSVLRRPKTEEKHHGAVSSGTVMY